MNKSDLITYIAKNAGMSKSDASKFFDTTLSVITDFLKKGEEIRIVGFGTFATRKRKASTGRNPRTGEEIAIPEATVPVFKAGKLLKDEVSKS